MAAITFQNICFNYKAEMCALILLITPKPYQLIQVLGPNIAKTVIKNTCFDLQSRSVL